jgi:tmRNA-binding protein
MGFFGRSMAKVKIAIRKGKTEAHDKEVSRQDRLASRETAKAATLEKAVAIKENERKKAERAASELADVRARVAAAQERQAKAKAKL